MEGLARNFENSIILNIPEELRNEESLGNFAIELFSKGANWENLYEMIGETLELYEIYNSIAFSSPEIIKEGVELKMKLDLLLNLFLAYLFESGDNLEMAREIVVNLKR